MMYQFSANSVLLGNHHIESEVLLHSLQKVNDLHVEPMAILLLEFSACS